MISTFSHMSSPMMVSPITNLFFFLLSTYHKSRHDFSFTCYKLKVRKGYLYLSFVKEGEEGESEKRIERETQLRKLLSIEEFPHQGECEVIYIF